MDEINASLRSDGKPDAGADPYLPSFEPDGVAPVEPYLPLLEPHADAAGPDLAPPPEPSRGCRAGAGSDPAPAGKAGQAAGAPEDAGRRRGFRKRADRDP